MNGRMGWSGTLSLPLWIVIRAPLAGGSGLGLAINASPEGACNACLMLSDIRSFGHLPALGWECQRSAEMFQNHAAMFGHIEFFGPIAEHVVDEPRGQFQQELAAQRLQDPLDAHPVFDDAIQHQIPDLVVVMGFGEHALGSVSERRAAFAPGCVLAVGDLQVGHRLEGDRAYFTGTCPFSFAQFATLGTRRLLGSAMNRYKDNRGSIRAHACVLSEEEPVEPHSEGRKP